MDFAKPKVLILGHSFVRRLSSDLEHATVADQPSRLHRGFNIHKADIFMHGIGGRTVDQLHQIDLQVVVEISPDVVIIEIGTNDLSRKRPEVAGSELEHFVRALLAPHLKVKVICVCHVTPRALRPRHRMVNRRALLFNQYVKVVLEVMSPRVFCWTHQGFVNPSVNVFRRDGVHYNPTGQYMLYRSYRGAILKALRILSAQLAV